MNWKDVAARGWIESQDMLDRMFKPIEELLIETIAAGSATRVLDVGCGTGSTTVAVVKRLGAEGHSVGVDISEPMIAAARTRARLANTPAEFVCADAQEYAFAPASFEVIISRFGVMFFDDFARAFANLRSAARHGAELRFVAWRGIALCARRRSSLQRGLLAGDCPGIVLLRFGGTRR